MTNLHSPLTVLCVVPVPVFKAGSTADNSKPTKAESGVVSETSVSVQLLNAFSDNNGPILGYTVIVSTDPSAVTAQQVLPSWSDARGDPSIVAYQVRGATEPRSAYSLCRFVHSSLSVCASAVLFCLFFTFSLRVYCAVPFILCFPSFPFP